MTALTFTPEPGRLHARLMDGLLMSSVPLGALALRLWDPASRVTGGAPTLCPFRICTGHACPGCGLTRAAGSLVNGEIGESFRMHPVAGLVAFQVVLFWIMTLAARAGHPAAETLRRWWSRGGMVTAVLLVGVWALRWKLGLLDVVL